MDSISKESTTPAPTHVPVVNDQAGSYQGNDFDLRLFMLFFLRAFEKWQATKSYFFEIDTQSSSAPKFDDVVLKYKTAMNEQYKIWFVQAKHGKMGDDGSSPPKLTSQAFLSHTGDFAFLNYANAYIDIKQCPEFEDSIIEGFILATNREIEATTIREMGLEKVKIDNFALATEGAEYYRVSSGSLDTVCSKLATIVSPGDTSASTSVWKAQGKLKNLFSLDRQNLKNVVCEFLKKFTLVVKLPNEAALRDVITKQIQATFKQFRSAAELSTLFPTFQERMSTERKRKAIKSLTHLDCKKIFREMERQLTASALVESENVRKILNSGLYFKNPVIEQIKIFLKKIFAPNNNLPTSTIILSCKNSNDDQVLRNLQTLLTQSNFLPCDLPFALKIPATFCLTSFWSNSNESIDQKTLLLISKVGDSKNESSSLFRQLNNFLKASPHNRIILLTSDNKEDPPLVKLLKSRLVGSKAVVEKLVGSDPSQNLIVKEFLEMKPPSNLAESDPIGIFHIKVHYDEGMELCLIKIFQALKTLAQTPLSRLYCSKGNYFFESLSGLLNERGSSVIKSFKSPTSHNLLILFCDQSLTTDADNICNLMGELLLILVKYPSKRLILLTSGTGAQDLSKVFELLEKYFLAKTESKETPLNPTLLKKYDGLLTQQKEFFHEILRGRIPKPSTLKINKTIYGLGELIPSSLEQVWNTPVIFQGQSTSLGEILQTKQKFPVIGSVEASTIRDLNSILNTESLASLIKKEPLIVGTKEPFLPGLYKTREIISFVQLKAVLEKNLTDCFAFVGMEDEVVMTELRLSTSYSGVGHNHNQLVTRFVDRKKESVRFIHLDSEKEVETQFHQLCYELSEESSSKDQKATIHLLERQSGTACVVWTQTFSQHFYLSRRFYPVVIPITRARSLLTSINLDDRSKILISGIDRAEFPSLLNAYGGESNTILDHSFRFCPDFAGEEEFQRLCGNSRNENEPVHWLKMTSEAGKKQLEWYQSHGSTHTLQKIRRLMNDVVPVDEVKLTKSVPRIGLLADEPGMGKSTTLARIGERTKRTHPLTWVIKIDLNQHQVILETATNSETINGMVQKLSAIDPTLKAPSTRDILKYKLMQQGHVMLLLDAFDEVKRERQPAILNFLKALKHHTLASMWITTRRHDQSVLEDRLSVCAIQFEPLNELQQINFLSQFWKTTLDLVMEKRPVEMSSVEKYATEILEHFENSIAPIQGSRHIDKPFISIPLRARMLAEVFRDRVKTACLNNIEKIFKPDEDKLALSDLYEQFIGIKYTIYLQDKMSVMEGLDEESRKLLQSAYTMAYEDVAFKTLFPLVFKHFQPFQRSRPSFPINILHRIGLIQGIQDSVFFIHRTFEEYFVARRLVASLRNPRMCPTVKRRRFIFFLSNILCKNWRVIRAFCNDLMLLKGVINMDDPFKMWFSHLWLRRRKKNNLEVILTRGALDTAVTEKNFAIVLFLLENVPEAVRQGGVAQIQESLVNSNDTAVLQKLRVASFDIINFNGYNELGNTMLHDAVQKHDHGLIEVLIENFGAKVDLLNACGQAPIHLACDSWTVDYLVEKGAPVNFYEGESSSPLHTAALSGNMEVVSALLKNGAMYDTPDKNEPHIPLHLQCPNLPQLTLVSKLFDLVQDNKVEELRQEFLNNVKGSDRLMVLNARNSHDDSLLHVAYREGHTAVILILLSQGALYRLPNTKSQRPLNSALEGRKRFQIKFEQCKKIMQLLQLTHHLFGLAKMADFKMLTESLKKIENREEMAALVNARNSKQESVLSIVSTGDRNDTNLMDRLCVTTLIGNVLNSPTESLMTYL